jgi:3-dehydroquinate synthase
MRIRQSFKVRFAYDVTFTRDVFASGNTDLASVLEPGVGGEAKVVAFVDSGLVPGRPDIAREVESWCDARPNVTLVAPVEVVPGGEEIKNALDILDRVGRIAADAGLDRHSYVLIIGGGAVLDAVGFAASTVHRGLRQVRVPTTTLSQGDSGVGVKNGLNRFGQKNYYGAFAPPHAVVIDPSFLKTLDRRDWLSGAAEAFKVAVVRDREFLDLMVELAPRLAQRDEAAMDRVVTRSAEIHLDHICSEGDAFESGTSRPLDFGHWAAHRLEDMTGYELRHGEAVAVGMALDMYTADLLGLVTHEEVDLVLSAMERSGLSLWHEALVARDEAGALEIMVGLSRFREHLGGELTLAMPDGLGTKRDVHELPVDLVERSLALLRERTGR